MSSIDLIVSVVLTVILAGAITKIILDKKKGKSCGVCTGCPASSQCSLKTIASE